MTDTKYAPLRVYLQARNLPSVSLSFTQIESILGFALPRSASVHRAWWANENHSHSSHSHAAGWLEGGYVVDSVNLRGGSVTFVRAALKKAA